MARCILAERQFDALARGRGGPAAIGALAAARHSRNLLLLKYVVDGDPAARPAFDLLVDLARHDRAAVDRVLRHPTVGAWLARVAGQVRAGRSDRGGELAFVAAAAALRAGRPATVTLPATAAALPRIPLPSLGVGVGPVAAGPVAVAGLRWVPTPRIPLAARVSVELGGWPPVFRPDDLAIVDAADAAAWQRRLAAGWAVLAAGHAGPAAEFAAAIGVLTPLATTPGRIDSATLADAFGCVFLSAIDDPELVAVTLLHELQHAKLAALLDLFPLLRTDAAGLFYAPWRPDPRPPAGLLHGAYAHLGIARFWRARAARGPTPRAHREFARWRVAARDAAVLLREADLLNPLGRRFVAGMVEVLDGWCAEPVPTAARDAAERAAAEHRAAWRAAHGSGHGSG